LLTNQQAVPGTCAKVECGTLFKIQNFKQFPPLRLPEFIYLNLFVKPGHCSQETRVLDALPNAKNLTNKRKKKRIQKELQA